MTNRNLLRRLRKWIAPYAVSTIMVACRNFLITWLTALVGSSALNMANEGRADVFLRQLLFIALFTGAFLAFDTAGVFWQSITLHGIRNDLRSILYSSILKARCDKVYTMGQRGELLSRMNSDVDMAVSILGFGILNPLMFLISGIGATAAVAAISWKLCLLISDADHPQRTGYDSVASGKQSGGTGALQRTFSKCPDSAAVRSCGYFSEESAG